MPFMSPMVVFQAMATWDGWLIGTEAFWDRVEVAAQIGMIGILALSATSHRRSVRG